MGKGYGHSMMNLVYRRMIFFSVRMKSEVGPCPAAAAAAEAARFDPIPAAVEGEPEPYPLPPPRNDEREEAPK